MLSDFAAFRSALAALFVLALASACGGDSGETGPADSAPVDAEAAEVTADDGSGGLPDDADPADSVEQPDDSGADSATTDSNAQRDGSGDTADVVADVATDPLDVDTSDGSGAVVWEAPATHAILFVGNSYTYTNDLPSVYRTLALQAGVPVAGLQVESVTAGGYRLVQHAADAANSTTSPRLRTLLVTGAGVAPDWDAVVLQEQSQILGFPEGQPDRDGSITAGVDLAAHAAASGATAVLFMTWGYRLGDPSNPGLYGDYIAMQSRLEAGYAQLEAAISEAGYPVRIAPVGPSFRAAHALDSAAGRDPLVAGSLFSPLYSPDNSHPSAIGTYLAACVIVASTLGVDPTTLDGASPGVGDATLRDQLQVIARDQVLAEVDRSSP